MACDENWVNLTNHTNRAKTSFDLIIEISDKSRIDRQVHLKTYTPTYRIKLNFNSHYLYRFIIVISFCKLMRLYSIKRSFNTLNTYG